MQSGSRTISPPAAEGIVLDILRCSLHDGPGIRTTVFLKGCPLSCLWCHNAESQARKPVASLNGDRCAHCGLCVTACAQHCHTVNVESHAIDRTQCTACGQCAAACPAGALEIRGKPMSVAQVLAEVRKDVDYYRDTGGGLTISGGEPMQQFEFTKALAVAAGAAGLHVAVETCGMAAPEYYRRILPHVQLFLFDYKDTDPVRHARLTGVSNDVILQNLDLLHASGAQIVVRCPLIPGLNDTDEHLAAIAALPRRFPNLVGVEIMAYHSMGNEKARRAGVPVRLDLPSADTAQKQAWRTRLAALGSNATIS